MWVCLKCEEECPDEVLECWKCSAGHPDNPEHEIDIELRASQQRTKEIQKMDRELLELQFDNAKRFSKMLDQMGDVLEAFKKKLG